MGYKVFCGDVHTALTQQCHWVPLQFVGLGVCVDVGVGQCERTRSIWLCFLSGGWNKVTPSEIGCKKSFNLEYSKNKVKFYYRVWFKTMSKSL